MKSLLRFSLMLSLVVIGKITKQADKQATTAKAAPQVLVVPVRNASVLPVHPAVKGPVPGSGSRLWQATAPATTTTVSFE